MPEKQSAQIHQTGIETVLLAGEAPQAANHMANMAGISDVRAGCLPEDKLTAITEFQKEEQSVYMVGDGINDVPAFKSAQVGIAMGKVGRHRAIDASDIALGSNDIKAIPQLLLLSQKTMTIQINLAASMTLTFIAIILAIIGVLNPVVGALVHNAGWVAVSSTRRCF